ncbi:MAG: hypothetical protein ABFS56_20020 [Pseudomonadota bacterium]
MGTIKKILFPGVLLKKMPSSPSCSTIFAAHIDTYAYTLITVIEIPDEGAGGQCWLFFTGELFHCWSCRLVLSSWGQDGGKKPESFPKPVAKLLDVKVKQTLLIFPSQDAFQPSLNFLYAPKANPNNCFAPTPHPPTHQA